MGIGIPSSRASARHSAKMFRLRAEGSIKVTNGNSASADAQERPFRVTLKPSHDLVSLCGFPGSGRSTFVRKLAAAVLYDSKVEILRQDDMGKQALEGCLGHCAKNAAKQRGLVVVDRVNGMKVGKRTTEEEETRREERAEMVMAALCHKSRQCSSHNVRQEESCTFQNVVLFLW